MVKLVKLLIDFFENSFVVIVPGNYVLKKDDTMHCIGYSHNSYFGYWYDCTKGVRLYRVYMGGLK